MQIIKQYVELLLQFKPKKEEIALIMGGNDTKLYLLCENIMNNHINTDNEAALLLYNKPPNYPAYKVLKTEFKKRLINAILILDFKKPILNDIQQAYYTCQKNWAAINILAGRYQTEAAIDLAQTTLNFSLKYEITETAVNTSRLLIYLYHLYHPFSKAIPEYEKIHLQQSEMLEAETESFNYYNDLSKNYIRVRATQKHLHNKSIEYYKKLKKHLEQKPSYRLYFNISLIRLITFTSLNDFKGALKVIEETIQFIDSKPFELKVQIVSLLHQKVACCIQLKYYKQGKEAAQRSSTLVTKGTYNWYRDRLLYTQFCLHTGQYQEAWDIIYDAIQFRTFSNMSPVLKDEVKIFLSYLKYLIYDNKIKATPKELEVLETFDISGYIIIAPSLSKDKKGLNIAALISQLLWHLAEKNYDSVKARILALNKYKIRYINKEDEMYRTNLFIKMVNTFESSDYRQRRVEIRTEKTLQELKKAALNINNNALQTEILPYEFTFQLMLNTLA